MAEQGENGNGLNTTAKTWPIATIWSAPSADKSKSNLNEKTKFDCYSDSCVATYSTTLLFIWLFYYFTIYFATFLFIWVFCYFTIYFTTLQFILLLCNLFNYIATSCDEHSHLNLKKKNIATLLLTLLQCYLIC